MGRRPGRCGRPTTAPRRVAGAFGVGAGLTMDEFALWTHLSDVYWTEQGRSSLEAIGRGVYATRQYAGELDPDQIHTPGIFVKRIIQVGTALKRIEQRTVRKRVVA